MSTPPAKPTWTRCPACRQRLFNEPVDKEAHKQACPADLQRDIKNLGREITVLVGRVADLEERPVASAPLEPAVNDEIAEWEPITDDGHNGEPAEHPTDSDIDATQPYNGLVGTPAFDATNYYPAIDRDEEIELNR